MKPILTKAIINYAVNQGKRLKTLYPDGLSSCDLSQELKLPVHSARNAMNRHGFAQINKRYAIGDVAALITFRRWYGRKRKTKEA